jgi:calcium-dependent protein kinase
MGACTSLPRARLGKHEPSGSIKKHHTDLAKASNNLSIHEAYSFKDAKKLGAGGYGAVYRATQRVSGKERAVKRMSSRNPDQSSRCRREVAIMSSVDHPNIVKLVETFQDSRNTYLVVELCRGGELLSRMVAYGGSLSEQHASMVLQQIFRGTLYLHQCSIAHRDLKPENLLFASDAPVHGNTVKIIDFGFARTCTEGQVLTTKVGTPIFVAPEVLTGRGYGKQCDNWSIGIIAHVLLCGYPPFRGSSDQSVLRKVARGRFDFLPKHWARVSSNARALVSRLLSIDPQRRPTASLALGDDWLKYEADAEGAIISCGLVENLRRFKSRDVFSKAVLHTVAGLLDDAEVCPLRGAFLALDADGDGRLSPAELREGLAQSGLGLSEQELLEILDGVDVNGNGTIEYTEFLAATVDRSKCWEEGMCQHVFHVFDWDGDGHISRQDLICLVHNGRLSEAVGAESQAIVDALEINGDVSLNLTEFMKMLSS